MSQNGSIVVNAEQRELLNRFGCPLTGGILRQKNRQYQKAPTSRQSKPCRSPNITNSSNYRGALINLNPNGIKIS